MNIVCVICSDLLIPSDDVFYTPCGHIFHFVCLTQWLERSKSCPQCREKTTENKIHRIYFNFSNNDTITEDTSSLQDKIDKLNFQLLLRDKDINHYRDKNNTLEKQNSGLRKEVRKVESELNEKNSAIHALKEQTKYFRDQCSEIQSTQEELLRLKKKIEDYKNIQTLLDAPAEDVEEMMSRTSDSATLITYISVMKREMTISLNKRRELRSKVKSLQQELTKVSMERNFLSEEHTRRKKLEEDFMICESEKMFLHNKLKSLEKQPLVSSKPSKCDCKRSDKSISNEIENACQNSKTVEGETMKRKEETSSTTVAKDNETNSPYLQLKSQGVFTFKQNLAQRQTVTNLGLSILAKRSRIEQTKTADKKAEASLITYDGLGGHSKYDKFPTPIAGPRIKKKKEDQPKSKKPKLDNGDNQNLGGFIINLT